MAKKRRLSTGISKDKFKPIKNDIQERKPDISSPVLISRLHNDVLRVIAAKVSTFKGPTSFPQLHSFCEQIFLSECAKGQLNLDAQELWSHKSPVINVFYDGDKPKEMVSFHSTVREFVNVAEHIAEIRREMQGCANDSLDNFTAASLGWLYEYNQCEIRRCSPVLQKRIYKLFKDNFQGTTKFVYVKSFLRPSRFLKSFSHKLDTITALDLGDMRNYKATRLNTEVFPHMVNLREFTWHNADMTFVTGLPHPHLLSSLNVTFRRGILDAESLSLILNCQRLEKLYTGFPVPQNATKFDLDVLLRSYHAFWNQRQYIPSDMLLHKGIEPVPLMDDGEDAGYALQAFPRVNELSFWNAPEYIFPIMAKLNVSVEILQFGQLSQELNRLCSFDSLMQALFKFSTPKYDMYTVSIKKLKLYLHSMPVVTLDYYLPQLMKTIAERIPSITTLDLFVHCKAGSTMPCSWLVDESSNKGTKLKLENLSEFSLHIDGFCILDDLDTYLPSSISKLSLSFVIETQDKNKFLKSYRKFVKRISDINLFPDLESISIQVVGLRCFESILNCIVDDLSGLKHCSILSMPVNETKESLLELIASSVNNMPKLKSFGLLPDLIKFLHNDFNASKRHSWTNQLADVQSSLCIENSSFVLEPQTLPALDGFDSYNINMLFPAVDTNETTELEDVVESSVTDNETNDSDEFEDEEDSFVHGDDIVDYTDEEDELEVAERKLNMESKRRHDKYEDKEDKRRQRCALSSSDDGHDDADESHDVIVFKKGDMSNSFHSDEDEDDGPRNAFLDDQAVESDGSDDSLPTEPEEIDIEGSDDEELFLSSFQNPNAKKTKPPPAKRRKIIVSDSE